MLTTLLVTALGFGAFGVAGLFVDSIRTSFTLEYGAHLFDDHSLRFVGAVHLIDFGEQGLVLSPAIIEAFQTLGAPLTLVWIRAEFVAFDGEDGIDETSQRFVADDSGHRFVLTGRRPVFLEDFEHDVLFIAAKPVPEFLYIRGVGKCVPYLTELLYALPNGLDSVAPGSARIAIET